VKTPLAASIGSICGDKAPFIAASAARVSGGTGAKLCAMPLSQSSRTAVTSVSTLPAACAAA
jgi:hypothetical protein